MPGDRSFVRPVSERPLRGDRRPAGCGPTAGWARPGQRTYWVFFT